MKIGLRDQFLLAIVLGVLVFGIGPIWVHRTYCSLHGHGHVIAQKPATGQNDNANQFQNIIVFPTGTYSSQNGPDTNERQAAEGEHIRHPWLCSAELTDIAIAFFTYCLVVVGWATMRSNEETVRDVESPHVAFHFRAQISPSGRLIVGCGIQNGGASRAVLKEWYVGLLQAEPKNRFPNYPTEIPYRFAKTDMFVPVSDGSQEVTTIWMDPSRTPYIIGYFKYRDIFKRMHTARICMCFRDPISGLEPAGHPAWSEDT